MEIQIYALDKLTLPFIFLIVIAAENKTDR